MNWTEVAEIG